MKNYFLVSYKFVNGFMRDFVVHIYSSNLSRLRYLYESDKYNYRKDNGYIFDILEDIECLTEVKKDGNN